EAKKRKSEKSKMKEKTRIRRFDKWTLPLILSLSALAGCEGNWFKTQSSASSSSGSSGMHWFGKPGTGEIWTIEGGEFISTAHRRLADDLAGGLKHVKQLRADRVNVVHLDDRSTIYYGEYTLSRDSKSNTIVLSPEIKGDMQYVRSLSPVADQFPFLSA